MVIHIVPFEISMMAKMAKIGHFEAFLAKMAIIAMTMGDMCMTIIYIYFRRFITQMYIIYNFSFRDLLLR